MHEMALQTLLGSTELIQVADIGAAVIAETPAYQALLDHGMAHLNAFEGDARQIAKIKTAYTDQVTIFPDFLSDGSEKTVYLASEGSGMTSLLKPNPVALKFFNGFDQLGAVLSTQKIRTRRLDDVAEAPDIDFLKMDIQGSELTVLQNGTAKLANCIAIQLEISYVCLYEDQPAFGEIDVWMRGQGYLPHCFLDVKRWSIAPTVINNNIRIAGNQLLESDIVYIKNPLQLANLNDAQLKKMALVAHYCFHSVDLCVHILLELISRGVLERSVHIAYLHSLNQSTKR